MYGNKYIQHFPLNIGLVEASSFKHDITGINPPNISNK